MLSCQHTSEDLIDIVYRVALCDHSALGIWAQNIPQFKKMLGDLDYARIKFCVGQIFTEGIDYV